MQTQHTPVPTDAELEILQILWSKSPESVRYVNECVNRRRAGGQKEIGYTTTLKQMQVMLEKGLLQRDIVDKNHLYRPAISREVTQTQVIRAVAGLAFDGSASSLVLRAIGSGETSLEELEKIKALIAEMERKLGNETP